MSFRIALEKENFKFSVSHFTIFGSKDAERLHGHNYYVSIDVEVSGLSSELGMAFDFNALKPMIRQLTDELDERVLLPEHSPHLKLEPNPPQIRVSFASKRYEFPLEDVAILPVSNITSEELARHLSEKLVKNLRAADTKFGLDRIRKLTLGIQETRGQGVFYTIGL